MNKLDRETLIKGLKKFDFSVKSLDNINVSIVTSGGVDVKEINARTCESKLVENLYFIGEVLDISQQRVSQIRKRALDKMYEVMKDYRYD